MTVEVVVVPQDTETPMRTVRGTRFSYRYGYARSNDSRASGDGGQDYLVVRHDEDRLAFALCDGVSQSYYGDIASVAVGDALIDWLWEQAPGATVEGLAASLSEVLGVLTGPVTERVRAHKIPEHLPKLVADVLEQKRKMGSSSTFICGSLSLSDGQTILAWMGDSRLRIWGPGVELTSTLGDTFKVSQRWSSSKGLVGGAPNVAVRAIRENGSPTLIRLMAYSDGLPAMDHETRLLADAEVDEMIGRAGGDDISFFEVWLEDAALMVQSPVDTPAEKSSAGNGETPILVVPPTTARRKRAPAMADGLQEAQARADAAEQRANQLEAEVQALRDLLEEADNEKRLLLAQLMQAGLEFDPEAAV